MISISIRVMNVFSESCCRLGEFKINGVAMNVLVGGVILIGQFEKAKSHDDRHVHSADLTCIK